MPDLADRVERVVRRYLERTLPHDPSGEVAGLYRAELLMVYGNWRGRFVPEQPRRAPLSGELATEMAASPYRAAVLSIKADIEAGKT